MNNRIIGNDDGGSTVLANLYDIGLALTSKLDLAAVLELVGESARRILGADIATCHSYDQETNTYVLLADVGYNLVPTLNRNPRPGGPTATIVRTRQALISNDALHEDTPYRDSPYTRAEGVQSVIGLPLKQANEVVGVLHVNYRTPGRITPDVKRKAELLANQAAVAIYNARLFQRLSEREAAMSRLVDIVHHISEAIATSRPEKAKPILKLVLDEIARAACQLIGADCAVVYPYDMTREEFYDIQNIGAWGVKKPFELSDKPRSTTGMAAYVKREGSVIRNDIAAEDPDMLIKSPFIKRENVKAFVGVAIGVEDTHLGVLYVNFRTPHQFTTDERHMIRLFANQAGVALQIARLLEREQSTRTTLEMLDLWNQVGHFFAHRLANIAGPTPVAVRRIRRELDRLKVQSPVIDHWLNRIETDITQLAEMASRLRKLRELQGAPEPTDVNQVLSSVMQHTIMPSIRLVEQYAPNLPLTSIPRLQVSEVFENIVKNAVEAMPTGGVLTVTTELSGRRWIEVNITDTGPGMDQAKKEKIFDLFYSEKEGGLGFGLWWSRTFMRHIGGDIFVESEPGKGSTFTTTVPLIL
jgi:signal transduction histidine kinase